MKKQEALHSQTENDLVHGHQQLQPFGCDIRIDPKIFNDKKYTDLINQILDGHKICDLACLIKLEYDVFVYDRDLNDWFFFNGFKWKTKGGLDFKRKIYEARSIFNKILVFYENEKKNKLLENVQGLIFKMSNTQLKSSTLEEAKLFFEEPDFSAKLNSKRHLVPFENGVIDLLTRQFRNVCDKNDFIELTFGYDYDPNANNPAVQLFLAQVMPDPLVRDFMLKKLSDCLNGDRPNTLFLFLLGSGSNGKSQLMNLMAATMGQFGIKVDSALFTRKRPDANAASPAMINLKDKRFACTSEPEEGEKLNLSLIKELTGSECSIQARRLQENMTEFKMQAKFCLCTNELPEMKGDEGFSTWRRIRVIEFPTSFVGNPTKSNEIKADPDIPTRIEQDITWRQTFFNILWSYYDRDIDEPEAVMLRTDKYRADSNEIEQWVNENIEFYPDGVLELTDLNTRRFGSTCSNLQEKGRFRKSIEKVFFKLGACIPGFAHELVNTGGSKKWRGVRLLKKGLGAHHTENKLYEWLKVRYDVEREKKFPWAVSKGCQRRYDFYIATLGILIELDGAQHFESVKGWRGLEEVKQIDQEKNELAVENGLRVIRICQRIVLNDSEKWDSSLSEVIRKGEVGVKYIGSVYGKI